MHSASFQINKSGCKPRGDHDISFLRHRQPNHLTSDFLGNRYCILCTRHLHAIEIGCSTFSAPSVLRTSHITARRRYSRVSNRSASQLASILQLKWHSHVTEERALRSQSRHPTSAKRHQMMHPSLDGPGGRALPVVVLGLCGNRLSPPRQEFYWSGQEYCRARRCSEVSRFHGDSGVRTP